MKQEQVFQELDRYISGTEKVASLEALVVAIDSRRDAAWKKLHAAKQLQLGQLQQRESLKALYRSLCMQGLQEAAEAAVFAAAEAAKMTAEVTSSIIEEARNAATVSAAAGSTSSSSKGKKFQLELSGAVIGTGYRSNMEIARKLYADGLISAATAAALKKDSGLDVSKLESGQVAKWKNVTITRIV